MISAQWWLEENYPKDQRKSIEQLVIQYRNLEGHLDLSDFVNLKNLYCDNNLITSLNLSNCSNLTKLNCDRNKIEILDLSACLNLKTLDCGNNRIKTLDLSKNAKLEIVSVAANQINADLSIFSHLTNLEELSLGLRSDPQEANDFFGSLKSLENLTNLELVNISGQSKITGSLDCLTAKKLNGFLCQDTEFEKELRPYGYDLYSWQLVNVTTKFNYEDLLKKIKKTKSDLLNYPVSKRNNEEAIALKNKLEKLIKKNESSQGYFQGFSTGEKVAMGIVGTILALGGIMLVLSLYKKKIK